MLLDTPLHITGGTPLHGEFQVQSSKNAALPIIAASIISPEPVRLYGVPRLADVYNLLEMMQSLGTQYQWLPSGALQLYTPQLQSYSPPHHLVSRIRASFNIMGALLARAKKAEVAMPGGCAFGYRPVDQHIKAFKALGIEVQEEGGSFYASASETGANGRYVFDFLTVGGTQNALQAAVLGSGTVVLENASIDTDVVELANFLNSLGAKITGGGTHTLTIEGVSHLSGGEYHIIPDRLEAGTMMLAAVAARSKLTLTRVNPKHLYAVSSKLQEMGVKVTELDTQTLEIDAQETELKPVNVTASEFPGFPTDLLPQMAALLSTVPGTSVVLDKIYPDRLSHVSELRRMGAKIDLYEHTQVIQGGKLYATPVRAADIRAGAALVVAALACEGKTIIDGVRYLNRGYERLAERLAVVGVQVEQQNELLPMAMD